jgi:hypothetical protein
MHDYLVFWRVIIIISRPITTTARKIDATNPDRLHCQPYQRAIYTTSSERVGAICCGTHIEHADNACTYVPALALRRRRAGGCRAEACFRRLCDCCCDAADRHTLSREPPHLFLFPLVRSYDATSKPLQNSTVARANEHCPNAARQGGDLSQAEAGR